MKKILSLILPVAIIFSLIGCFNPTETYYIKKDLREKVELDRATGEVVEKRYQVRIDGKWYDSDKSGNLTRRGQQQKQQAEADSDGGGGGGGGC